MRIPKGVNYGTPGLLGGKKRVLLMSPYFVFLLLRKEKGGGEGRRSVPLAITPRSLKLKDCLYATGGVFPTSDLRKESSVNHGSETSTKLQDSRIP